MENVLNKTKIIEDLKKEFSKIDTEPVVEKIGTVVEVGDGIAIISGQ